MSEQGPGLALQKITKATDPQIGALVQVIGDLDADVLLLTGIDYDLRGAALDALAARLEMAGAAYPHRLALRPNTGIATGFDLDGNGRLGEARDAMGYGRFAGAGAMAVLSRLPIDTENIRDFSGFLWVDLPGSLMPDKDPAVRAMQPLSTTGMYEVPILGETGPIRLLAYYATPPVFDGPEDRNGRRNHDETAFWTHLIAGDLPFAPPKPPFVLLGQPNLDPVDGEGRKAAIRALLANPALQDPAPRGSQSRADPGQKGDATLDTALYDKIGGMRVEQILPSADLKITGAGVVWPPDDATLATASRHRPVWVDVMPP